MKTMNYEIIINALVDEIDVLEAKVDTQEIIINETVNDLLL